MLDLLRIVVFAIVLASGVVALAAWAVRTRQVNPFSGFGRALRSLSEPIVRRGEPWLVRRGGNPQNAAWWIFGTALIGGILVIALANGIAGQVAIAGRMATDGRGMVRLLVYWASRILMLALIIRVIASWFGQFRYSNWM